MLLLGGCAELVEKPDVKQLKIEPVELVNSVSVTRKPAVNGRVLPSEIVPQVPVDQKAAVLFANAEKMIAAEDFASAESLLLQLIVVFPQYSSPRTNLAILYVNTGRADEAVPLLRAAIAIEPKDCIPRMQLGLIERSRNDFVAAEQAYLGCLAQQPNNADVHLNLGILYELYMGRFEDALAAYDQYQQMVTTPDRRVAGWISNLSRRVKKTSQLASGELN